VARDYIAFVPISITELPVPADVLDVENCEHVMKKLRRRVDNTATERVTLDLRSVTFVDSSGLGAVIELRNHLLESGRQLVLRNLQPRVERTLVITGLIDILRPESETA
jgi:anti-sigma B factor antagonist